MGNSWQPGQRLCPQASEPMSQLNLSGMSANEQPSPVEESAIKAFQDQARWLLEWHNKRNDGFATRSVALLGFTGVILALLPRGLDLNGGVQATGGVRACLVVTAAFLLLTAGFCLLVLAPQRTNAPSIKKFREQWRDYADGKNGPRPSAQITEELLHGRSAEATSPVDWAFSEANRRARWFMWAVISLGLALLALAVLVVQVFWQA